MSTNLTDKTIVQLKKILKNEKGSLPSIGTGAKGVFVKKDIIDAILKNRDQKDDYISELPTGMIESIFYKSSVQDIPSLCQTNKTFRKQCFNRFFWSKYLSDGSISSAQDKLFDLFQTVAEERDIDLFRYLWDNPIVVKGSELIKEKAVLLSLYSFLLAIGDEKFSNYIYSLNPDLLKKMKINDDSSNKQFYKQIYEFVHRGQIGKFRKLILENKDIIDIDLITFYLSYSPTFDFLSKAMDTIERFYNKEDISFSAIMCYVFSNLNFTLIEDMKSHGQNLTPYYPYYLRSKDPNSDKLVQKDGILSISDAIEIGYSFGNEEVAFKYLKQHPNHKIRVLMWSLEMLSNEAFMKIYQSDPKIEPSEDEKEEIMLGLEQTGRDYLLKNIK